MKRFFKLFVKESARAIAVPLILFAGLAVAFAFTEPAVAPTGGTVYAPVNTGATAQTKSGSFTSSGTLTGNILNATTQVLSPQYCIGASCITTWSQAGGGGVTSINGATGAMTFNGAGVSQSGNTFTFSGGGAGTPGGSSGQVQFNNSGTFGGDLNLFWDNTNKRLGIGTAAPSYSLTVTGNASVGGAVGIGTAPPSVGLSIGNGGNINLIGSNRYIFFYDNDGVTLKGALGITSASGDGGIEFSNYSASGGGFYYNGGALNIISNLWVPTHWIKSGRFYVGDSNKGFSSAPGIFAGLTNVFVATNSDFSVVNSNATAYMPAYASAFIPGSSIRFKSNITESPYGLKEILKLEPKRYHFVSDPSGKLSIGFIAEDVVLVLPEIVALENDGTPKGVDYDRITAVLVAAVKEQQKEIELLKARIDAFEKK